MMNVKSIEIKVKYLDDKSVERSFVTTITDAKHAIDDFSYSIHRETVPVYGEFPSDGVVHYNIGATSYGLSFKLRPKEK